MCLCTISISLCLATACYERPDRMHVQGVSLNSRRLFGLDSRQCCHSDIRCGWMVTLLFQNQTIIVCYLIKGTSPSYLSSQINIWLIWSSQPLSLDRRTTSSFTIHFVNTLCPHQVFSCVYASAVRKIMISSSQIVKWLGSQLFQTSLLLLGIFDVLPIKL